MSSLNNMYWELLNNEIRSVSDSADGKELRIVTNFRTIQNVLEFKGVVWHQDLTGVVGSFINYIELETEDNVTEKEYKCLSESFRNNFSFDALAYEGLKLYRIICNKSKEGIMVVANNINIIING